MKVVPNDVFEFGGERRKWQWKS